jgi:hypothetical protein
MVDIKIPLRIGPETDQHDGGYGFFKRANIGTAAASYQPVGFVRFKQCLVFIVNRF